MRRERLAACQVAIDESDLPPAPGGLPYIPEPILFNVNLALTDAGRRHAYRTPTMDGGGTCGDTSCEPPAYVYWFVDELPIDDRHAGRSRHCSTSAPAPMFTAWPSSGWTTASTRCSTSSQIPSALHSSWTRQGPTAVGVRAIYFVGDRARPDPTWTGRDRPADVLRRHAAIEHRDLSACSQHWRSDASLVARDVMLPLFGPSPGFAEHLIATLSTGGCGDADRFRQWASDRPRRAR